MSARSTSPVLTFDTLLASVVRLELSEKLRLRRLLEEEIAQAEEEAWDPGECRAGYPNEGYYGQVPRCVDGKARPSRERRDFPPG